MSQAFSPSRSLKYCRITLRTVKDSSFSLPPSDLVSDLDLCCKCHLVVVFEPRGALQHLVEKRATAASWASAVSRVFMRARNTAEWLNPFVYQPMCLRATR